MIADRRRPARRPARSALATWPREGMALIVTSGGLGPTADDLTAEVVGGVQRPRDGARRPARAPDRGDPRAADAPLAEPRPRGDQGLEPQAGDDPRRRDGDRSRSAPHRGWSSRPASGTQPDRRGPAGSAPRAAADVGDGRARPTRSRPRSRARPIYRRGILRLFGIPESEIANTLRAAGGRRARARAARDHDLPAAAARSRSLRGTSRRPRQAYEAFVAVHPRPPPRHAVLRRRLDGRRAGRAACWPAGRSRSPSPRPAV